MNAVSNTPVAANPVATPSTPAVASTPVAPQNAPTNPTQPKAQKPFGNKKAKFAANAPKL